jgi:predicted nucleotidyltransferase
MNNESPQRSVAAVRPIDPSVVRVLRSLDPIAKALNCAYFVAGATARDLVLVNVHGLLPGRATRDIDFGIAVESWTQFAIFKERLVETEEFVAASKAQQRVIFKDQALGFSVPVDLIPFRGVSSLRATIAWPPGQDVVMNVARFEEALGSSVLMEIDPELMVRVASVPGITLLKLTAWADRGRETNKDAADLYRLLAAYADAGNTDRLYDQEMDLLEAAGFDMDLAGAELLGRDVARIADSQATDQVRSFLASQPERERLASHMARTTYAEATPAVDRLLDGFCRGFLGTT